MHAWCHGVCSRCRTDLLKALSQRTPYDLHVHVHVHDMTSQVHSRDNSGYIYWQNIQIVKLILCIFIHGKYSKIKSGARASAADCLSIIINLEEDRIWANKYTTIEYRSPYYRTINMIMRCEPMIRVIYICQHSSRILTSTFCQRWLHSPW